MRIVLIFPLALALCGCGGAGITIPGTDDTPPIVIIQTPVSGSQIHGTTTVSFHVEDFDSPVNNIRVTVNGTTIFTSAYNDNDIDSSTSFTPATPGDFVIVVYATSQGGLETSSITVHYDGT